MTKSKTNDPPSGVQCTPFFGSCNRLAGSPARASTDAARYLLRHLDWRLRWRMALGVHTGCGGKIPSGQILCAPLLYVPECIWRFTRAFDRQGASRSVHTCGNAKDSGAGPSRSGTGDAPTLSRVGDKLLRKLRSPGCFPISIICPLKYWAVLNWEDIGANGVDVTSLYAGQGSKR
jgi:hypothetical protein